MEKLPDPIKPRDCPDDMPVYCLDHLLDYAQACVQEERERIRALIKDDAFAAQYQTFPQYRTALLRAISRRSK